MLAMDVSLSMRVNDVKPTRLAAAQEAAKLFLRDLPKNIDVGLVTFAGSAQVAQAATLDRASLVSAIDAFQMQYGTAIGNAIVVCLSELFPDARHQPRRHDLRPAAEGARPERQGQPRSRSRSRRWRRAPTTRPPSCCSATAAAPPGVDTLEAAKMAADRGVRIHVVGLGTVDGVVGEPAAAWPSTCSSTSRRCAKWRE